MPHLTVGNLHLSDGVDCLGTTVELFAISEVLFFNESHGKKSSIGVKVEKVVVPWKDIWDTKWTMLRARVTGFVAGVLAGAGAPMGNFPAYMSEKSITGKMLDLEQVFQEVMWLQKQEIMHLLAER